MPKRTNLPGRRPKARRRTPPPATREVRRQPPAPVAVQEREEEPAPPPAPEARPAARAEGPDYSYVLADLVRIAITSLVVAGVLVLAVFVID